MFNKLILNNSGEPFEITFVGATHQIPSGKFEAEATLGEFILSIARKWKKDVKKLGVPEEPKVEAIKEVDLIAPVKEEPIVDTTVSQKPLKKKKL